MMASNGTIPDSDSTEEVFTEANGLSTLNRVITSTGTASNDLAPPKVKICVFCGARPGSSPAYMEAARALARTLHQHNIGIVFGGGTSGLMGEVAKTLVSLSGPESVHGIIPLPLMKFERGPESEVSTGGALPEYEIYGKTTVVKTMHQRKKMMAEEVRDGGEGSGFVAMPGGYGTLEELFEITTWSQLGILKRGVTVLNVNGYFDNLLKIVENAVDTEFISEGNRNIIGVAKDGEEVVALLKNYVPPAGQMDLQWDNF